MPDKNATTLVRLGEVFSLTPIQRRLIDSSVDIRDVTPPQADFLHSVLCQVGMPRSSTNERVFERQSGSASMMLEAGQLWNGHQWEKQPLPYGPCPRLVMVHISSQAIKTRTKTIDIGNSVHQFLQQLGMQTTGGKRGGYTTFRKQIMALAASRLTLGYMVDGRPVTMSTVPIHKFEAWLQQDERQAVMWPGVLELSQEFYNTLTEHAVPLDSRALAALKHSALALDIYTWLAHRLHRVSGANGVRLSWSNLYEQFGQEYNDQDNFKKKFVRVLRQVKTVYPAARVDVVRGGLMLYSSPPPLPKSQTVVSLPYKTA